MLARYRAIVTVVLLVPNRGVALVPDERSDVHTIFSNPTLDGEPTCLRNVYERDIEGGGAQPNNKAEQCTHRLLLSLAFAEGEGGGDFGGDEWEGGGEAGGVEGECGGGGETGIKSLQCTAAPSAASVVHKKATGH